MNSQQITICFAGFFSFVLQLNSLQAIHAPTHAEMKGSGQERVFQAGALTSNTTPFLGEGTGDGWIKPNVTHLHDEFHSRCLVLDDGKTRLAFVVLDDIGVDKELAEETKRFIGNETSLPVENIMISATHTHSSVRAIGSPPFNDYQKFIIRRIADGGRIAINNLEPARVGWGVGSVPQHVFVRRWIMSTPQINPFGVQEKVNTNPGYNHPDLLEPAGEPDTEVSFISVQSTDGRPIALFANYSLHYVGIGRRGHLSAGYFPIFADRIRELLSADRQDPPFVGIMSNGTSGDVNNLIVVGPRIGDQPYERAREVADDVAKEVLRVDNSIQHHDWVPLQAVQEELTLETRKPDRQMIERAELVLSRPDSSTLVSPREPAYAERILRMVDSCDQIDIVLQAFRVGELGIATIPFETFAEIGLEIKARSPFQPTFTILLANGYHGYLAKPEQHEVGGYETWLSANRVEMEASRKIVAQLLELFTKSELKHFCLGVLQAKSMLYFF